MIQDSNTHYSMCHKKEMGISNKKQKCTDWTNQIFCWTYVPLRLHNRCIKMWRELISAKKHSIHKDLHCCTTYDSTHYWSIQLGKQHNDIISNKTSQENNPSLSNRSSYAIYHIVICFHMRYLSPRPQLQSPHWQLTNCKMERWKLWTIYKIVVHIWIQSLQRNKSRNKETMSGKNRNRSKRLQWYYNQTGWIT